MEEYNRMIKKKKEQKIKRKKRTEVYFFHQKQQLKTHSPSLSLSFSLN
jgi:hypothetical protein